MKPGDLVVRNETFESYGLDPDDPRTHGVPEVPLNGFVPWSEGEVGMVVEEFVRMIRGELPVKWVRVLVPCGSGFCHAEECEKLG